MGGGHGGAAHVGVESAGIGAVDAGAGGADVHGGGAVVVHVRAGGSGGGDGDDVGGIISAGIKRGGVVVGATVAGRRDKEDAGGVGGVDRGLEGGIEAAAPPGIAAEMVALGGAVVHRRHGAGIVAVPGRADELAGDQADVPAHTRDADTVVADRADGAGAMGAVAVVVHGIVVPVVEIVAVEVVDIAVAVVIHAVAGDLAGIDPHVGGEVGVGVIDTGVDDHDQHAGIAGVVIPGLGGVDVVVGSLVETPQVAESGIVGGGGGIDDMVGGGHAVGTEGAGILDHGGGDGVGRGVGEGDEPGVLVGDLAADLGAVAAVEGGEFLLGEVGGDDDVVADHGLFVVDDLPVRSLAQDAFEDDEGVGLVGVVEAAFEGAAIGQGGAGGVEEGGGFEEAGIGPEVGGQRSEVRRRGDTLVALHHGRGGGVRGRGRRRVACDARGGGGEVRGQGTGDRGRGRRGVACDARWRCVLCKLLDGKPMRRISGCGCDRIFGGGLPILKEACSKGGGQDQRAREEKLTVHYFHTRDPSKIVSL